MSDVPSVPSGPLPPQAGAASKAAKRVAAYGLTQLLFNASQHLLRRVWSSFRNSRACSCSSSSSVGGAPDLGLSPRPLGPDSSHRSSHKHTVARFESKISATSLTEYPSLLNSTVRARRRIRDVSPSSLKYCKMSLSSSLSDFTKRVAGRGMNPIRANDHI